MSHFDKLVDADVIRPPRFLRNNVVYEVITGSVAYGTNLTDKSDFDLYGVVIPLKEMIFPHLAGEIIGFGHQARRRSRVRNSSMVLIEGEAPRGTVSLVYASAHARLRLPQGIAAVVPGASLRLAG